MNSRALAGKRVLVPRGKKNASAFSAIVEEFGGIPVEVPLLEFRPVENRSDIDPILTSLYTYDWLIFTSDVTVETFFAMVDMNLDKSRAKIAVIGEKTEEALLKRGISVDFKPEHYVAESFVKEFSPYVNEGERLLIPKGNLARDYIAQFFKEKGHVVDEIIIYETYFPEDSRKKLLYLLRNRKLDILPFTSPSTIEHFMSIVTTYDLFEQIKECIVATIGPVSKRKCEQLGLTVHVCPKIYTSYEMMSAIAQYMMKKEKIGG
ncbi:uroporphyrinogen-III synthase [Robertmurraya siralis]|uniref:Uroporphyrinogen-III synthase n=1 Tax=Robertmurraya siralis TaxID=77777 RepID=A0A919WED5_9BACI|nr:uroporphyrinogen-III synthase [Robertmurraya siralis]GIN60267.1 uroporphyrinogen-III synthase [Robertmurraya siralis]